MKITTYEEDYAVYAKAIELRMACRDVMLTARDAVYVATVAYDLAEAAFDVAQATFRAQCAERDY